MVIRTKLNNVTVLTPQLEQKKKPKKSWSKCCRRTQSPLRWNHCKNPISWRKNYFRKWVSRKVFFFFLFEERRGVVFILFFFFSSSSPPNLSFIFFFGDLNYRINLDYYEVKKLVESKSFLELVQSDQLWLSMQSGRVFKGFMEGKIAWQKWQIIMLLFLFVMNLGPLLFPPTYRYDIRTNNYDTSEKKRIPAWCDRILFLAENVKQYNYLAGNLMTSDHKPVSSMFMVKVLLYICIYIFFKTKNGECESNFDRNDMFTSFIREHQTAHFFSHLKTYLYLIQ